MIDVETEGFEQLHEKLRWFLDRDEAIGRFIAARMAEVYLEELEIDNDHVHLIRVDARDETLYGVSLEPDPESMHVDEVDENTLLFLAPRTRRPPDDLRDVLDANPWHPPNVPVSPQPRNAVWVARRANRDEIREARERNQRALEELDETPLDPKADIMVEPDVAYDAARAEFGLSDERSESRWRPALRALIEDRLGDILEEATTAIAESDLDEGALPTFERRSAEWWERHSGFMDFVWG